MLKTPFIAWIGILVVALGCASDVDPAVGDWYGKVEYPEDQAEKFLESLDLPEDQKPPVELAIARFEEARYMLKLREDGNGSMDGTACRWRREGPDVIVEVGSGDDPEIINLSPVGKFFRGDGYLFAPRGR